MGVVPFEDSLFLVFLLVSFLGGDYFYAQYQTQEWKVGPMPPDGILALNQYLDVR